MSDDDRIYGNIMLPTVTQTAAPTGLILPANGLDLHHESSEYYSAASLNAISRLEAGVVVTVFSLKRRPERMHLMAVKDLSFLLCVRALGTRPEITVDLSRVQEIRPGRRSSDFERWPEEANKEDSGLCLVVFYGSGPCPQPLSIAARNREDFDRVLDGLKILVQLDRTQPYQSLRHRWYRRQFQDVRGTQAGLATDEKVTMKQLRGWLLRNSLKLSKKVLHPIQQQLCLGFTFKYGGFVAMVTEIMRIPVIMKRLHKYFVFTDGLQCITPTSFLSFLKREQNETTANEISVKDILKQFWDSPTSSRQASNLNMLEPQELSVGLVFPECNTVPPLTDISHLQDNGLLEEKVFQGFLYTNIFGEIKGPFSRFEDFLFSTFNSVWDPAFDVVHQDMTLPMTDYWIASSHNTYLTGNQLTGLSSEEMYARCLRNCCRCVELDLWDGSDGQPVITHGRTLTTKVRLAEVLKVIKENAWLASEYPIILSIENHLSLPQQRYFARLLKDVFGEELLIAPVDPNETQMPSPEKLKRKIIVKGKKLHADHLPQDSEETVNNLCAVKTGTLMLKGFDDKSWHPYTFGVTDTSLFFTYEKKEDEDDNEDEALEDVDYEEYFEEYDSDEDEEELMYQPWYYGNITRKEVKRLLMSAGDNGNLPQQNYQQQQQLQKGAFLVRDSERDNNYVLSFLWEGDVKHVRIKTREENGRTLYTFGNEVWYPTIAELVRYFRNHRLYIADVHHHLLLDKPVCRPLDVIHEEWYRPTMDRFTAERLLARIPQDGAFLLRASSEPGCLSLSFRCKNKISHVQIYKRGKAYVCGSYRFLSLPKMVDFFRRRPIYRKTKLTVAADESIAQYSGQEACDIYDSFTYCDPSVLSTLRRVTVRALYDFIGQDVDQLSFTRGAIITNVKEEDKPWWRGDYGEKKQKYFPANYVQVISDRSEERGLVDSEGTKMWDDTLDLKSCRIDPGPYMLDEENLFCFQIEHIRYEKPLEVGCKSLLQLQEWVETLRESIARLDIIHMERLRLEKAQKLARELSDLSVYCQATSFDPAVPKKHYNVSSLVEDKISADDEVVLRCSRQQLLRVYPKAKRITSTNFDPIPMWVLGVHMVALNYQTPDTPMQLNHARFLTNGSCGYVLKPAFLRDPRYSPADIHNIKLYTESIYLTVTVLAGRNLCSDGRMMGVVRPFVVVEILGLPLDNRRSRTKAVDEDNGLNPVWNEEPMKFDVSCPELAFLRFEVLNEVSDNKTTIAQATFPVQGLRQGYRSVLLRNKYSDPLDMSALLVHIHIKTPQDAQEENLFRVMAGVRRYRAELSASDTGRDAHIRSELLKAEQKLLDYLQDSRRRGSDQSRYNER